MAHAAASRAGHGHEFFAQVENLLRKGAPIRVGWGEAHYARILRDVVPARFPLARKAMERVEEARERAVERFARKRNLERVDVSDEEIVGEFADAAMELRPYRVWRRQSPEPLLGEKTPQGIYTKCLTLPSGPLR